MTEAGSSSSNNHYINNPSISSNNDRRSRMKADREARKARVPKAGGRTVQYGDTWAGVWVMAAAPAGAVEVAVAKGV